MINLKISFLKIKEAFTPINDTLEEIKNEKKELSQNILCPEYITQEKLDMMKKEISNFNFGFASEEEEIEKLRKYIKKNEEK